MIRLAGNLKDIFGVAVANCSLQVQLCGYGAISPRVLATAMLARTTPMPIPCPAGAYDFQVYGNDVIVPGTTYYTIQILDDQQNVIQTNGYVLTGAGTFDLSNLTPALPAVIIPVAPTVTSGLVVVPFNAAPTFDCALVLAGVIAFEITLTGNVVAPVVQNMQPGQLVTFVIIQDATGAWTFAWPLNVKNAGIPDPTPLAINTQTFVVRGNGILYPVGPMEVS